MHDFSKERAEYQVELLKQWSDQTDGAHDLGHIHRVWNNCLKITHDESIQCDLEILVAAAFFHDLVNLSKGSSQRHLTSTYSAKNAAEYLSGTDFPDEKIPAVQHAIEAHSFSANIEPTTFEAQILQDADRLDALGAIGIARTMYVAGTMNKKLFDTDDPCAKNRPLDDVAFALDHFEVKLFKIADTLKTRTGKKLAQIRITRMRTFYNDLIKEVQ